MLGNVVIPKYIDPGSPVVQINVNGQVVKNVLIDLGAAINVMTKHTMDSLNISNIRSTPTVLQLADSSTVKPDGIVEDVIVILESWEYPADFTILSVKATLGGYPVILGRPWLATADAFIGCHSRDMTISDGQSTKKLALYPPARPQPDLSQPVWPDVGEEIEEANSLAQLMMIQNDPFSQLQSEDALLFQILQYNSDTGSSSDPNGTHLQCFLQQPDSESSLPKLPVIFHNLLPQEVQTLPVDSMSNLTEQIELSQGHCLNINNKLS